MSKSSISKSENRSVMKGDNGSLVCGSCGISLLSAEHCYKWMTSLARIVRMGKILCASILVIMCTTAMRNRTLPIERESKEGCLLLNDRTKREYVRVTKILYNNVVYRSFHRKTGSVDFTTGEVLVREVGDGSNDGKETFYLKYFLGEEQLRLIKNSFRDVNILGWESEYERPGCDGFSWEVAVYDGTNRVKRCCWTRAYPKGFYKFVILGWLLRDIPAEAEKRGLMRYDTSCELSNKEMLAEKELWANFWKEIKGMKSEKCP